MLRGDRYQQDLGTRGVQAGGVACSDGGRALANLTGSGRAARPDRGRPPIPSLTCAVLGNGLPGCRPPWPSAPPSSRGLPVTVPRGGACPGVTAQAASSSMAAIPAMACSCFITSSSGRAMLTIWTHQLQSSFPRIADWLTLSAPGSQGSARRPSSLPCAARRPGSLSGGHIEDFLCGDREGCVGRSQNCASLPGRTRQSLSAGSR